MSANLTARQRKNFYDGGVGNLFYGQERPMSPTGSICLINFNPLFLSKITIL